MKKIVVIGNAADVIEKKRGSFLDSYFDEIIVINKTVFNLETHKEYIGTPTMWCCCGWKTTTSTDRIFDPPDTDKKRIYGILKNSKIKRVLFNHTLVNNEIKMVEDIPKNISIESIVDYKLDGYLYHSAGLQSILYAIAKGYEVYYFGIDSYRKSHHYYQEEMPEDVYSILHTQSNYVRENYEIKKLIKEGKLKHIDTVC